MLIEARRRNKFDDGFVSFQTFKYFYETQDYVENQHFSRFLFTFKHIANPENINEAVPKPRILYTGNSEAYLRARKPDWSR